jgi:hypothetical protein
MAKRTSIDIKGFTHQNPIPNATRIGNILVSGVASWSASIRARAPCRPSSTASSPTCSPM